MEHLYNGTYILMISTVQTHLLKKKKLEIRLSPKLSPYIMGSNYLKLNSHNPEQSPFTQHTDTLFMASQQSSQ